MTKPAEKPYAIYYRLVSHPRVNPLGSLLPFQFHSSYATREERDRYFDILMTGPGGQRRIEYRKN